MCCSPDVVLRNPGILSSIKGLASRIPLRFIAYREVGEGREQERKFPGYKKIGLWVGTNQLISYEKQSKVFNI